MWLISLKLGAINMHNVIRIYQHDNYVMLEDVKGNKRTLFEGQTKQEAQERYKEYLDWLKSGGRKDFEI